MNTLKFLAFLRGYITYIFQVRVKHYLSTKLVQIKRMLRLFSSAFYAIGIEFSSGFHRAIPIKTRCGLDENPMKCRNSVGIGRVMLCCIAMVFQSSNYSFKVLKSIRALALLALLVSMFSLSAQTPRKDSGADGLSQIKALYIGDDIPQSLWDTPLDVVNNPNGQKTIKLSDYRDKRLIILDFWASWCGSCIENMEHVRSLEAKYKVNTVFLKVNSFSSKDSHERIVKVFDKFKSRTNVDLSNMEYIFRDSVLERYFAHVSIPHIVWIYDGKYIGSTYAQGLTSDAIDQVLHNKPLRDHLKNDRIGFQVNIPLREQIDLDEAVNPVVEETFTGYVDGLDPDYGTFHKNDKTYLYRTVNIPLKQLYVNAFSSLFLDVPSWAISVDTAIASPVCKALNNLALRNDAFCFEVASSDTLTNEDILQRLRYCLLSNFKVTPVRTIEKASYWQLEVVDEKRVKESVRFFDKKGNRKYITFEELKSKIYLRLQLPINDLTTVKSNLFEIEVPKKLDWTDIKSIQVFLVTKGLRLKRVEKDIPTITFKKA